MKNILLYDDGGVIVGAIIFGSGHLNLRKIGRTRRYQCMLR